ncbi:MAG: divalent-cation tolerance protein CutA [Bdellovibrionales bacterium]|nr:divalent-cation tolerance protein CutA [Bdellovibrionales bacterium]
MSLLYVTVPNSEAGEKIANELLQEKWIACANLMPAHKSFFRWEGEIQGSEEHVLILKTRRLDRPALTERIKDLHPYECPCILTIDPIHTNPEFVDWIYKNTEEI